MWVRIPAENPDIANVSASSTGMSSVLAGLLHSVRISAFVN